MVKGSRLPGIGGMAGSTELPKRASMCILASMATVTSGGRTLVRTIVGMAAGTDGTDMSASQFESG